MSYSNRVTSNEKRLSSSTSDAVVPKDDYKVIAKIEEEAKPAFNKEEELRIVKKRISFLKGQLRRGNKFSIILRRTLQEQLSDAFKELREIKNEH